MKFILNENKKFLLREKFILNEAIILTEASIVDVAKKWKIALDTNIEESKKALNKLKDWAKISTDLSDKKDSINKIKQVKKTLETSLRMPESDLISLEANESQAIKQEAIECIDIIKSVKSLVDKTIQTKIDNQDTTINSIVNKNSWNIDDIKKLKSLIDFINKLLEDNLDVENITSKEYLVDDLKSACEESIKLVDKIKSLPNIKFDNFGEDELNDYIECVQKIVENASFKKILNMTNGGLVIANIGAYVNKVNSAVNLYNEFLKLNIWEDNENKEDWALRYNKAVNKEAIIEAFIYRTWPKDAEKVIKIIKAFQQECVSYGFTKNNPFISFISEVYLKYNLSVEAYNIIHNQVASKALAAEDLVIGAPSTLGAANLVFCKAFYELDSSNMKVYLKKQNALSKITSVPAQFKSIKEVVYNIFYKNSEIIRGNNLKSFDQTLNDLKTVERLEQKYIGDVTNVSTVDANIEKNTDISIKTIIDKINSVDEAINVVAALAIKFSSSKKIIEQVKNNQKVSEFMYQNTTVSRLQSLIIRVDDKYGLRLINESQAYNLVKSILSSDKFKLN